MSERLRKLRETRRRQKRQRLQDKLDDLRVHQARFGRLMYPSENRREKERIAALEARLAALTDASGEAGKGA